MNKPSHLLFFIFLSLLSACHIKNDWAKEHLKGNVKSIIESYYPVGKGELDTNFKNYYVYNENGNTVERKLYNKDSLLNNTIFTYNDKNNLTEKNTYSADSLVEKIKYYLADNGHIIKSLNYNLKNKTALKYVYAYDNNNNIIEADGWNSTDSLKKMHTLKSQYKFDGNGNDIEETYFDINGVLQVKQTLAYDNAGNLISADVYQASGNPNNIKFTYNYEFDKPGNWIKQTIFNNDTMAGIKKRQIEYY